MEIYRVENLYSLYNEVKAVDIDRNLPRIYIDRILRDQACSKGTLGNRLTDERLEG